MAVITLENEKVKAELNTLGGYIESLVSKEDGVEHAWHYDSALWPRRTAVCFPLCGKCKDDLYTVDGKEYSLPNHGFLREREMVAEKVDSSRLVLTDRYDDTTLLRYPFKYEVKIEYVLDENKVNIYYDVKNLDDKTMYYSIGSHYTYLLPRLQEECSVFFSKKQKAGAFNMETGGVDGDVFSGSDKISLKGSIDNSSIILRLSDLDTEWVGVGDEKGIVTKIKGENFKNLIIWAPAGGKNPFVCIEFWDGMGHVSTFGSNIEEKYGINTLQKGEERRYLQSVELI